ncbi:MAG: MFS transporter [Lactobacillus sp.]|jgi:MFS family permease|nr:MFS transporter [Lactobacillus sp.]
MDQSKRRRLLFIQLISTQNLIVPIKVLFYLHFFNSLSAISLYKTFMILAAFVMEIPSGYLAGKYGNKLTYVASKYLMILALLLNLFSPNFIGFILANLMAGIAAAFDTGSGHTYFLKLAATYHFNYDQIIIAYAKWSNLVALGLTLVSSVLYAVNIYVPFIITLLFYVAAIIALARLPKEVPTPLAQDQTVKKITLQVIKQLLGEKQVVYLLVIYAINTSLLISNFDYYAVFFKNLGIPTKLFGAIFATFSILGILGVKVFEKATHPLLTQALITLLLPLTFVGVYRHSMVLVLFSIVIQQIIYGLQNVNYNVSVINSIENLQTSAYYQSIISVTNTIIRILLTGAFTLLLSRLRLPVLFNLIGLCLFVINALYWVILVKLKKEQSVG